MRKIFLVCISVFFFVVSNAKTTISFSQKSSVVNHAANQLALYLEELYPKESFKVVHGSSRADIQLILSSDYKQIVGAVASLPSDKESYLIHETEGKLYIIGHDPRGVLNGVYALLREKGMGFYIGGDQIPKPQKWVGFKDWHLQDTPSIGNRFLFNWHNFISGCTGWSLNDWKLWIDQANKMGYNSIMIHAYGNNPMFSYDYLGETKATGFMNNSSHGRDWGNQNINDVRRIEGGQIYDDYAIGASPSFASEDKKVKELTIMMQQTFAYAKECGTEVKMAIDFDTWMSHPQNIVKKMNKDVLFEIFGRSTPNPEHPEGYEYYKHQVKSLLELYPEVNELVVWSRSASNKVLPQLGTIWMAFKYEDFPKEWQQEFDIAVEQNPKLKTQIRAQGFFAFTKVISAIKKAALELDPNLKISYGSWTPDWLDLVETFLDKEVAVYFLDDGFLDSAKSPKLMATLSPEREVNPIIWAHHDDYAYIGRPFTPNPNLSDILKKRKASGLGIIHWTTHPLDLYFSNVAKQLWKASENEPLEATIKDYVKARFGESNLLEQYFLEWLTKGPIFGRETSDHFVDLGKIFWKAVVRDWDCEIPKAHQRIALLDKAPKSVRTPYWHYQRAMEEFYISFFENQSRFSKSYNLLSEGRVDEARTIIEPSNPLVTIQKFVAAYSHISMTEGERALVLSLNWRWYIDFENIKQRLALEPARFRFSQTTHDPLAQMPGKFTYHVDKNKDWWVCKWQAELPKARFEVLSNGKSCLVVDTKGLSLPLTTIHGNSLLDKEHIITLNTSSEALSVEVVSSGKTIASELLSSKDGRISLKFIGGGEKPLSLKLTSKEDLYLYGMTIE